MSFNLSISRRLALGLASIVGTYVLTGGGFLLYLHDQGATAQAANAGVDPTELMALASNGLAIGVSLAIWAWLSRTIAKPVKDITKAMNELATGNHDVTVPSRDRRDEIGQMANAVEIFKSGTIEKHNAKDAAAVALKTIDEERAKSEKENQYYIDAHNDFMARFGNALERCASGDFVSRLNEPFINEYESIRQNFNTTVNKLQSAMLAVQTSAQAIRTETSGIANAADTQSRRVAQQAASLEEAAAALVEITHAVQKTAEHTEHAHGVASSARNDAEKSGTVVRQAVNAMTEIEKSSQQINRIIGVIDEIAFQTNLLALNAGVEAARAGEAGRGFAVVATEVRALAQRSADAAKEIKSLISAATSQIGEGVELVGQSGNALDRILHEMGEISSIVAEIATSAKSQATGLQDVSNTVNQMDKATQQNAAVIEETSAASNNLSREIEDLFALISRFEVGEAPASRPSGRAMAA